MAGNPILLITAPDVSHANLLYELFQDEEIQREFPQIRPNSVNNAKAFLERQTDLIGGQLTFFRLIKIGYSMDPVFHGAEHTHLVGFISVHETGIGDFAFNGGLNHHLSFAVGAKYKNNGIMTEALKMTINAMTQNEFNFIGALVKTGNFASERVLVKNGFDKVITTPLNSTFIRRICMSVDNYNRIFLSNS